MHGTSTMSNKTVEQWAEQPDKLEGRAEYLQGTGYDVTLEVTYRRVRRVRALNDEQAGDFAVAREAKFAPKYFHAQNHGGFTVERIEAATVAKAKQDEVVDD